MIYKSSINIISNRCISGSIGMIDNVSKLLKEYVQCIYIMQCWVLPMSPTPINRENRRYTIMKESIYNINKLSAIVKRSNEGNYTDYIVRLLQSLINKGFRGYMRAGHQRNRKVGNGVMGQVVQNVLQSLFNPIYRFLPITQIPKNISHIFLKIMGYSYATETRIKRSVVNDTSRYLKRYGYIY